MTTVLSREEYERLKKKLENMVEVEMPELERQLGAARERGDLSENAEYDAARQAIWMQEGRIKELQTQLATAQIIDTSKIDTSKAVLGATVTALDLDEGFEENYILVGHRDESSHDDAVSINSPVGQALLGCKVDDVVEVEVPRGTLRLQIQDIQYN